MSLAVIVITSWKRKAVTLPRVLESLDPDVENVVVGDWPAEPMRTPYFEVAPITHTTIDALIKRDVGTVATTADDICYLCDDHRLDPGAVSAYRERYANTGWDILVPSRYTVRNGQKIWLNVGRDQGYCGGHAGIYRRDIIRKLPWSAGPHHPNWDLLHTHALVAKGARLVYADQDLAVEDIEPMATPWL